MNLADNKFISNFLNAFIENSNFFALILDFVSTPSACFVATLIEIFFYIDFTRGNQKSLSTNSSNSLLPFFIPILDKHVVKNLLRISKLYKKTLITIKIFIKIWFLC